MQEADASSAAGPADTGGTVPPSKRRNRRYCCVVNCHEQEGLNPDVKLDRFPSNKDRRERWAQAVKRKEADGKPWVPKGNSRICSRHFVGNAKNDCSTHPAYVPTIFPQAYKRPPPLDSTIGVERFERRQKRS